MLPIGKLKYIHVHYLIKYVFTILTEQNNHHLLSLLSHNRTVAFSNYALLGTDVFREPCGSYSPLTFVACSQEASQRQSW